jgi:hypothetical protein
MTVKPWVRRWLFLPCWFPGYWHWNGWIGRHIDGDET